MLIIFILNSNKLWVVDTFKDLCHFQWCSSLLNGNFVNLGMSWMIFRIYEIFLNTCTYMYILVLYPVKFNIKYHLWFTTYHLINCNLLAPIFAVQSYLSSDIDCSVYRLHIIQVLMTGPLWWALASVFLKIGSVCNGIGYQLLDLCLNSCKPPWHCFVMLQCVCAYQGLLVSLYSRFSTVSWTLVC